MLRLPGDFGGSTDPKLRERGATAAICFCHKKPITRGFVCSVCLTVLCSFAALCPICGSRFTLDMNALPITRPPPLTEQYPELPPLPPEEEKDDQQPAPDEHSMADSSADFGYE